MMADKSGTSNAGSSSVKMAHKKRSLVMPALAGGLAGFASGAGFVAYYFGTFNGIYSFTHTMALVHEGAGVLIGVLAGLSIDHLWQSYKTVSR